MSETYFVTGGTGFIGRRLAERLVESGKRVRCLARATSRRDELKKLGVELVDGDLTDVAALRRGVDGVDAVFHLAGLTRELVSGEFMKINCGGAVNVAEACLDAGVGRLVVISSLAGAGVGIKEKGAPSTNAWSPYRLRRETDPAVPLSPYGRSKSEMEIELAKRGGKLAISVVRPPYVFGEGDALSLPLYSMVKNKGLIVLPGYIDRYYSFVYVDDLVEILMAVEERGERLTANSLVGSTQDAPNDDCGKGIYFSACPVPIKFSEFGTLIGRAYGRDKVRIVKVPPMGVLGAGVFGEVSKRVSHKYPSLDLNKAVEALRGPWICSGEKAKSLGVDVSPELSGKIERAAKWYEARGLL